MEKIIISDAKEIHVPPESLITVLGVVYVHRKTSDGGDIYLTRFGLPNAKLLQLENWYEREWFEGRRERLEGTSAVYRVPTKEVDGKSLELVVKNCRVGEDVPVATRTLIDFLNAEFNSPWEEFSLVMEMMEGKYGPSEIAIGSQEPLAIYVPPGKMQMWQSGRSQEKINRIQARHPGIALDILRQYKLIYGWIRGRDAVQAFTDAGFEGGELTVNLRKATDTVIAHLDKKGFAVADMKPQHIIIGEEDCRRLEMMRGTPDGSREMQSKLIHDYIGHYRYSVIDYELLLRTPGHEDEVKSYRRHTYLDDQRDRFKATELPSYLTGMEILDVPYVHGHVESTGGQLWVVGRNSRLFDYFLPERWRKTPAWKLSENNDVYYTVTKDKIHIIWKPSRVGEYPQVNASDPDSGKIIEYGYNSPFEEFSIALALGKAGIPSVYVRAIYMTGIPKLEQSTDTRRYESHKDLVGPDGNRLLRENYNFITIRGYYNGPDEWVARQTGSLCRPLDLKKAQESGVISANDFKKLYARTLARLREAGYDGSLLKGNDLLIALMPDGKIMTDGKGEAEVRICNFELIGKLQRLS